MSQHTPGPWQCSTRPAILVSVPRGEIVANFLTGIMPEDARLIACAPEMLAVLQDCEQGIILSTPADFARLNRIRAVISKATGE